MARKYEEVWKRLVAREKVILQCPKKGVKAVCQAIYKEKHRHQDVKRQKREPGFGRIQILQEEITEQPRLIRLIVTLAFIGDML